LEDIAFKKDETPYLIFTCTKCKEYSYVKTTQKTKKCLRCGRTYQVRDILKDGEVVYGMTEAVNTVKRKQNDLAIPEFRSGSDFVIATNGTSQPKQKKVSALRSENQEIDYTGKFNEMLLELSKLYERFPKYMLEIMAQSYGIPALQVKDLVRNAILSGKLFKNGDDDLYYKYQL
jgi:hypothetical protein